MIAGNAGMLVARVIYVKQGADKPFVIVDAAMNDLIRPTLYDAHHDIRPVVEASPDTPRIVADVVGPVCETGDYLALSRDMPAVKAGDLIAIMTAGAYGAVQANTYNTRLLVPEVLVRRRRSRGRAPASHLRRADRPRPGSGLAGLKLSNDIHPLKHEKPGERIAGFLFGSRLGLDDEEVLLREGKALLQSGDLHLRARPVPSAS